MTPWRTGRGSADTEDVSGEEDIEIFGPKQTERQYLQLQLLYDLHLHPTLGRAPVIQGVLIVKMPGKQKKREHTHKKKLMSV